MAQILQFVTAEEPFLESDRLVKGMIFSVIYYYNTLIHQQRLLGNGSNNQIAYTDVYQRLLNFYVTIVIQP